MNRVRENSAGIRRIKAATRIAIEKAGGQTYAAEISRVSQSKLSEYASFHQDERFIPADVIADIEAFIEEPIITRELAEQQGYVLVKADVIASPTSVIGLAKQISTRSGNLVAAIIGAIEDGKIDRIEADKILPMVKAAMTDLGQLSHALGVRE